MKLRTKYLLFIFIVHLITLVLSYFVFASNKLLFLISELFIFFSMIVSWSLYRELVNPLKLLMQGVEAIRDRDFNVKFVATGKYEMDQLINVYNHMIDELRAERIRQEEQHFFLEKLIFTSPAGILILDYENVVQQVNPAALLLLQREEKSLLRNELSSLDHPVLQHVAQLKSGESKTITLNGAVTYKLHKSHFIDRGFPRNFIMLQELTAEILAAEKNAYGKVIRMMAHEVNNTVGPVNSILQSAQDPSAVDSAKLQHALQVAIDRNQNLNIFMRNFADVVKLPTPVCKTFDLHILLREVLELMQWKAAEREIRFQVDFNGGDYLIFADRLLMEQVLINILKNSMESIESGGTVTISADAVGKKLIIADTGGGVSEEIVPYLFSPFFSTRKDGQGIGLTLIKEILLNHGFSFSLKTVEPARTEFVIWF